MCISVLETETKTTFADTFPMFAQNAHFIRLLIVNGKCSNIFFVKLKHVKLYQKIILGLVAEYLDLFIQK